MGRKGNSGISGGGSPQNYELTTENSGGFLVIDNERVGEGAQFIRENSEWSDSIYGRAFGPGGDKYNDPEVKVIEGYQSSSMAINSRLREDNMNPSTKTKVNKLTKTLDNAEVVTPFVAHRSSDGQLLGIRGEVTLDKVRSTVGKTVTDKGFTSTALTASKIGAYDKGQTAYIRKTGGTSASSLVRYHIETPAGKGIGGLVLGPKRNGGYVFGSEFIFNRGSQYRVTGAYEKDGVIHCNMQYVGNSR